MRALGGLLLGAGAILLAAQAPAPTAPTPAAAAGPNSPRELQRQASARYEENCSGCHGTQAAPGDRAPRLFDAGLLGQRSDEQLFQTIAKGKQGAEMPAFGEVLQPAQIWQMIAWLRLEAANTQPRPAFVANPDGAVIASEKQKFRIKVVTAGLDTPWGLAFLPDGRLLVTERVGRLRIVDRDGRLDPQPVTGTPKVWVRQDAGMLDVAVDPDFRRNRWVYLTLAELKPGYVLPASPPPAPAGTRPPNHPSMTVLVRGRIDGQGRWTDEQRLFDMPPQFYTTDGSHYGSRLLFDGKGHLFMTLGDRGDMKNSQDLSHPLGKVLRLNTDGSAPADNPFVGRPGVDPRIWSWGHRNPQGLAFAPGTGLMWETEHGPTGGDEINVVRPGANYGWGVVSMGLQPGIEAREAPGMVPPVAHFTPTIAPSGITFYTGSRYPGWRGSLFVTALAGQQLRRVEVAGDRITHQEVLFRQYGRVRAVTTGPDGLLYVLLLNPTGAGTGLGVADGTPGMVVRLEPVA